MLQKPLEAQEGWTDVKEPEMHKWDKPGEVIMGTLVAIRKIAIEGKPVPRLTLQLGARTINTLAPYHLLELTRGLVGCDVRIKYLGEDENVRGGPNNTPMKRFSVQSKGTPSGNIHGVAITDEDIPF